MDTNERLQYEVDVEDIEYLRHGDKPLMLRLFKPRGNGSFPLVVDLHGGAWCRGDRTDDTPINEPLARSGVVVAALDFRQPPEAGNSGAPADINYAIRWLKSRAGQWKARSDRVGVMGISSGGQQAMMGAFRHADPRYASIALAGSPDADARVNCVILCWPVIDPLGRYEYARGLKGTSKPGSELAERWMESHDQYWGSEQAMADGAVARALERGEKGALPPVLYLQGTADIAHPRPYLDNFVAVYRKAGGRVELQFFEGVGEAFVKKDPKSAASIACVEKIIEFVHRELG
jgi:acetyl esterase/lipase